MHRNILVLNKNEGGILLILKVSAVFQRVCNKELI